MNIVIVGHVDHGKSTLIGRLLFDTNSLPLGKLEQIKEKCRKNSKPFEYAFFLDALKDEQSQGITIDSARCFFKTKKREYIILDAPGHIEFLKNMITGASRAEAALLVIDAKEGIQENSKRHGYMLSMLGIKQVAVVINKMDLVNYDLDVFEKIKEQYLQFLKQINVEPVAFIPISAFEGDNVALKSKNMEWYNNLTILELLDSFKSSNSKYENDFRMPVQDVYKFTKDNDDRRIVAGTISSGHIQKGDNVVFYPSGKKSTIKEIESFPKKDNLEASFGMSTGFTLETQIYIKRGEVMTIDGQEKLLVSSKIKVNLFWLGKNDLITNKKYFIKIGTNKVGMIIEEIINVMNASNLNTSTKQSVSCNEVAQCIIKTEKPIAFDIKEEFSDTNRFVIVDNYEISGGGIILDNVKDEKEDIIQKVITRNYKWEQSEIDKDLRYEMYCQKPILLIFTGEKGVGKKELAKMLEKDLVKKGRIAYYLGIGSFLYGVDSDIKTMKNESQEEHIRRFAEVSNIMMDAGLIVIVTIRNLKRDELDLIKSIVNGDIKTVWIGNNNINDKLIPDFNFVPNNNYENISKIKNMLKNEGYIFMI